MRVLVCGSRDWTDQDLVSSVLEGLALYKAGPFVVIEGGARGADACAASWVTKQIARGSVEGDFFRHEQYKADWNQYRRGAGPIRNRQMLDEGKPDLVVAFKDGFDHELRKGGTENMVKQAKAADVPVWVMSHG